MTDKQDALQDIIDIAKRHNLSAADITGALFALPASGTPAALRKEGGDSILKKIFGYIGGIFILSGICAFIGMHWDEFGAAARVIITLGTGFTVFLMAVTAISNVRYEKMATPLFLVAAFFQPGGIFVMLDEYSSGGNPQHGVLFMAAVMLAQQGLTLWAKQRTILVFTSIVFGLIFFGTLFDLVGIDDNVNGLVLGISTLCICWGLGKTRHAVITPFWYFLGSGMTLFSFFDIVENTPLEILYLGLTAGLIYLSTVARSRSLLLTSTLGMLGYIGYFTAEHFMNVSWWPLALILVGVLFLGIGALAVRINNKYIKQGA